MERKSSPLKLALFSPFSRQLRHLRTLENIYIQLQAQSGNKQQGDKDARPFPQLQDLFQ
jgi:hypothetical protein